MNSYGETRWPEPKHCLPRRSGDCSPCLRCDNNSDRTNTNNRFMTVGSVRYGVRLGAVSPPPPGAGPRYRSQCCWTSNSTLKSTLTSSSSSSSTLLPTLPTLPTSQNVFVVEASASASPSSINSADIFSCVNRLRITDDEDDDDDADVDDDDDDDNDGDADDDDHDDDDEKDTSAELSQQASSCSVSNASGPLFLQSSITNSNFDPKLSCLTSLNNTNNNLTSFGNISSGILLKNQLRRRVLIRPRAQIYYTRFCDNQNQENELKTTNQREKTADTLDRLPIFRFGGNRSSSNNRKSSERFRELTDRLKNCSRGPVPVSSRYASPSSSTSPSPSPSTSTTTATTTTTTTTTTRSTTTTTTTTTPLELEENKKSRSVGQNNDANSNENEKNRTVPLRSASFSQVDYLSDDNKYVRKQYSDYLKIADGVTLTLPRLRCPKKDVEEKKSNENVQFSLSKVNVDGKQNEEKTNDYLPKERSNSVRKSINQRKIEQDRWSKSKRRKGMYISQWPSNNYETTEPSTTEINDECDSIDANFFKDLNDRGFVEIPKLEINDKTEQKQQSEKEVPGRCLISFEEDKVNEDLLDWSYKKNSSNLNLLRVDSLSEGENDLNVEQTSDNFNHNQASISLIASDLSDSESVYSSGNTGNTPAGKNNDSNAPRLATRYYKRPLRGPYGQMLEAEMNKNDTGKKQILKDLKFLQDLHAIVDADNSLSVSDNKLKFSTRTRDSSNNSLDESQLEGNTSLTSLLSYSNNKNERTNDVVKRKVSVCCSSNNDNNNDQKPVVNHQRTTSSPSKLESIVSTGSCNELVKQLLRGSTDQLVPKSGTTLQAANKDTRTHVVVELYDTEKSYVESLQTLVTKYLEPLKSPENSGLLDASLVDEIFCQIPTILSNHQSFLEELKKRLEQWDLKQKVGDVFLETFSRSSVIESYINYVNNWKRARDIIKNMQQTKPAFAKFLETTAREHKGKLALDSLLIKPIQKFPKYELLLQRLIKHTDPSHPDHNLLISAQKEVHDLLLKINCTEKEALEVEQLREIEGLIEGLIELVAADRQYLRHDLVSMTAGAGTRKERALFLFSDLLLVTSIKRRSGTIRKPSAGLGSVASALEANKYKLLMRISLNDLEVVKTKDENLKQMMTEIENLADDIAVLNQINELAWSLHCSHNGLDDVVKDMLDKLNKQLSEQQNYDSQLSCLELSLNTSNGLEKLSVVFSKPEKRASWEEVFNEAKHKLAMSIDRRPVPELVAAVPIRKTRAGLQFTCAAPTLIDNRSDVWVCNSDGYVGQVCVLSLDPEPTVTSCNGVCNARISCITTVPGISNCTLSSNNPVSLKESTEEHNTIQFDSSSSSDEDDRSDIEETLENSRKSCGGGGGGGGNGNKTLENASVDSDETESQQSTMWLGTEDGCIHVYNSNDNIRIKKNKIKMQLGSSILCIIYLDNRVYVSQANGDITIYERESSGGWNISNPISITIGSTAMPVTKLVPNFGKLWCSCGNAIKIFNTSSLTVENSFNVNNENSKHINCVILSGNGLWLSLQNSAIVKCFHAYSFELLCEVNMAPAVTKMLASCDDIIRQHKAACLRVTSLLACKDLLWIGTSAGVLLTMPLPHISSSTAKISEVPHVVGVPQGHTGHVRFITHIEWINSENSLHNRHSFKGKQDQRNSSKVLVISGGDGYEDFRSSNLSEVAGREDSTNHLLMWHI